MTYQMKCTHNNTVVLRTDWIFEHEDGTIDYGASAVICRACRRIDLLPQTWGTSSYPTTIIV